ncbi:hypothetical protein [Actomonas aquatica]|uniref:O-antigen polymerase n=1 Tax=Actomonas aquatica TaxID=2866162 RepID=A0ABZ1C9V4_9BACT|nr:hypothetical protein [Opitutus sp. WL0086]WRQ88467.1 hypothetical protein K1X11_003570 [Opitutus sp. WL0086]
MFMLVFGLICYLLYAQASNAVALLKIFGGGLVIVFVWLRAKKPGIPIVLIVAAQLVAVFGLPILTRNEVLADAPPDAISSAATEALVYGLMVSMGWSWGINRPDPKRHESLNFRMIEGQDSSRVVRLSFILLTASIAYEALFSAGMLDRLFQFLPTGVSSVTSMASKALSLGGGLLGGFTVSSRAMSVSQRTLFWGLFWIQFALLISGYLISSATGLMSATCLGSLIGSRRPPIKLMVILGLVCAFFNLTKFEMREAYWDPDTNSTNQSLKDLPDRYMEWATRSYTALVSPEQHRREQEKKGQILYDRVNNLSILMFVEQAVQRESYPLLGGQTYSLIPKLLIPRLFWPDKPRAHAGQELLNVHFGRQTLEQTMRTYIAWGLLAEAYGNFGPIWGAAILGVALGFLLGRVEAWSRVFALKSLQSFLILSFAVQIGTSFEMVASVFVTSTFQLLVAVAAASYLLVDRRTVVTSGPGAGASNDSEDFNNQEHGIPDDSSSTDSSPPKKT